MSAPNYTDKNMWRPHPNNPDDYCSTIPPLQQIQSSEARPPPTVMVPIGVLKRGLLNCLTYLIKKMPTMETIKCAVCMRNISH